MNGWPGTVLVALLAVEYCFCFVALSIFVFAFFSANFVFNLTLTQFRSSYFHPLLHLLFLYLFLCLPFSLPISFLNLTLTQYCLCFCRYVRFCLAFFLGQYRSKSNSYPISFFLLPSAFALVVALFVFVFALFSANFIFKSNSYPILFLFCRLGRFFVYIFSRPILFSI